MPEHAIRYWLKAGQQALGLSGMAEAAALLGKGLSLIAIEPDSFRHQEQELDLQIGLGQAIIATRGYAAPAVGHAFARARELCERLGYAHKLLPILYGQWAYQSVADLIEAHKLAAEIRHFSEAQDDTVVRVMSCRASGLTHLMLGDFAVARGYLEQGHSLYDTRQQGLYAAIYATTDPLIFFLSYLSLTLACCGHLDRARTRSDFSARACPQPLARTLAGFCASLDVGGVLVCRVRAGYPVVAGRRTHGPFRRALVCAVASPGSDISWLVFGGSRSSGPGDSAYVGRAG